jgi:hypothetical protein
MGRMLEFLKEIIDDATARLPEVTQLRAFGSWGYYVDGRIFALAYAREDRVGVKLPEASAHAAARDLPGASAWAPHGAPMSDWVLLPAAMLDDLEAVQGWVLRAFELVRAAPAGVEAKPARRPRARSAEFDAPPPSGAENTRKQSAPRSTAAKKTATKRPATKKAGR